MRWLKSFGQKIGYGFAGIYALGSWVYICVYVYEHWQGYWSAGTLAWYAAMRAIIWPVWFFV